METPAISTSPIAMFSACLKRYGSEVDGVGDVADQTSSVPIAYRAKTATSRIQSKWRSGEPGPSTRLISRRGLRLGPPPKVMPGPKPPRRTLPSTRTGARPRYSGGADLLDRPGRPPAPRQHL